MSQSPWNLIFDKYKIHKHNFDKEPFVLNAAQIKEATKGFTATGKREVRVLCKQDTREDRPVIFQENGLFILPIKNGIYAIIKGEGYVDIPKIDTKTKLYNSNIDFKLETSLVGNSEMQHLDFAYASSLIRTFLNDNSLVLTVRGRKYTPKFDFYVGKQKIEAKSVQTEVDAGYEGRDQLILIEAKNAIVSNTIIRQLYYPFRQWSLHTSKKISTLFFAKQNNEYMIWEFGFEKVDDYNSIYLKQSKRFEILESDVE